jgi:hypothetical protein
MTATRRLFVALAFLFASSQLHAFAILGFSPAQPLPGERVSLLVRLDDFDYPAGSLVGRNGNVIQLIVGLDDTPHPPQGQRTVAYPLGSLPAGAYTVYVYVQAPIPLLVQTLPLQVQAAGSIPALSHFASVALALLLLAAAGWSTPRRASSARAPLRALTLRVSSVFPLSRRRDRR